MLAQVLLSSWPIIVTVVDLDFKDLLLIKVIFDCNFLNELRILAIMNNLSFAYSLPLSIDHLEEHDKRV